ncbi:hypothetical protein RJT34_33260 [Clitoria ternatea]|uniref:PB1 domain-containing protein n=1 Tax=Clitoria ternatea TaxID=43366 RepID=A0AAN9F5J5_CLITE
MESKPGNINSNSDAIKFLYSYGGKIVPRRTDGMLRYTGGHTRVLALPPSTSFSDLVAKLCELCGYSVTVRCSLPNVDLETLITIKSDEDLANIIEEYDRASSSLPHKLKIRAILSPLKKSSPSQSGSPSSVTLSSSGSPYSSVESTPYSAVRRLACRNCSPVPVSYPIGVRSGAVKGCQYMRRFDGSQRFIYRGPYCNSYCH